MDTSAIDGFDPLTGPEQVIPDERSAKNDAFYAAASVGDSKTLEQTYDQVLGDLQRFGTSPVIENMKENWKNAASKDLEFKASDIVLNPATSKEEKQRQLAQAIADAGKDPTPKDVFEKTLDKPPLEINVIGGKGQTYMSNPPREETLGKFADFMVNLKQKMDQYEVKDWVPLIGGQGLGDLWMGDATDFFDAVSYYGLKEAFEYAPVVAGGRANPMNYRVKKGAVDAVFMGMDVGGLAGAGKSVAQSAVKGALKDFAKTVPAVRIEPTMTPMEALSVVPNTPITVIETASKEMAADLASKAVKSPKMADAIGTTPEGIVRNNLLPKADPELAKVYPDIAAKLEASDQATLHYFDLGHVDPYLFDTTAIKANVDMHYRVMQEQAELTPMMASSYLEATGRSLKGTIVYGKSDNVGFTDDLEVFEAREEMVDRVSRNYAEEMAGKSYDDLSAKGRSKLRDKVGQNILPFKADNGEWFLKWKVDRKYDPIQDTFLGYGATSAKLAHWEVGSLANSSVGKWFYNPAARLPQWITAGFARATIRTTNLEKVWGDVMRNEVLATRPRQELAKAIYRTEELGKNLSIADLKEEFPGMKSKDFKSLVNGYYNYRRLVDYQYAVVNNVYRTQKITAGYKGAYDGQGRYIDNLIREVKKDEDTVDGDGVIVPGRKSLIGSDQSAATEVYDFKMVDAIENGQTVKKHKGGVSVGELDLDNTPVYRLDKPVKQDGKVYEFAIGITEGKTPDNLLPQIPGYYPHINDEHYFIKAIPDQLVLNGKAVPKDAEHMELYAQHASTVGVERTQKKADEFAQRMAKENPDFTYKGVYERSEIDDNLRTAMDTVKYAQDVAKSRRQERLTLSDGGLGRLEDPAVSLDKRLKQAARLYEWKDIDFEFRQQFMKEYGDLTKGEFPKTVNDIQLHPNLADKANKARRDTAINVFEQYAKQQRTADTFTDKLWQGATLNVGRFMEEVSPGIADAFKEMSHKRDPVLSTALKVATVKYIHLNPIKQYITQPAQLLELNALALSQGNTLFTRDMASMTGPLLFNSLTRGSDKIPEVLKKFAKENSHIPTGYTSKEYQEILDAFWDSGIPKSIDLHAVLDGVFRSASDELDVGVGKQVADRAMGTVKGVASLPKQVGYNTAELINQIGMWLYSRSEFIRLNPGKKWNDPKNLEAIAAKQWGVGNSMTTRADLLPYQEGTMRAFMQFTAVSNKGMLQPLNSKFLTKAEKTRLAAIRLAAFGEKGIVALPLAMEMIKRQYYSQTSDSPSEVGKDTPVDEFFRVSERGLTDLMVNKTLQLMFDEWGDGKPKTELMVGKTMALSNETGVPMGDFIRDTYKWLADSGKASDVMPFLPAVSAVYDTVNILWDSLRAQGWENLDAAGTMKYIAQSAEFASGYSNFEKGLTMLHYQKLADKFGNPLDISTTTAEAIGKMAGLQSYKEDAMYSVMKDDAALKKEIQNGVKKAVASLHAIEDIYATTPNPDTPQSTKEIAERAYKEIQRVKHLSAIYAADEHLQAEFEQEFWRQLEKEEKGAALPLIKRIMDRKTGDYDTSRKMMAEKLLQMRQTGDESLAKLLSNLEFEIRNPKGE